MYIYLVPANGGTMLCDCEGKTACLTENGSLLTGLWLRSPAGWLPRTGISSGRLRSCRVWGRV